MKRPIAPGLGPNLFRKDALYALGLLLNPFVYKKGSSVGKLEQWFRQTFKVSYAVSFNSGRSSLFAILKAFEIGKGDEVIVTGFTCVAVPNAVIWTGATPVYIDIDNSFTLNPALLEKKITRKTKAILVQHTFGVPAQMEKILEIAKNKKIAVIEDCAHGFGNSYKGKKLGTFGDAAFFSFGRDKAVSATFGGIAITNSEQIGKKLRQFEKKQEYPKNGWIIQQIFHPVAFAAILPLYNFLSIGKIILVIFQKIGLLSFPYTSSERKSDRSGLFVKKLPNVMGALALFQLRRLAEFNNHRKEISHFYAKALSLKYSGTIPYLRFPLLVENRDYVLNYCKGKKIYLGKWYSEIVDPKGTNLEVIGYQRGSCPHAEYAARRIINLPTYPSLTFADAKKVVEAVSECIE